MSGFASDNTALAIIRRAVSPMHIGRIPGFLSGQKGDRDFGSTYDIHILLATWAREWQRSLDAPLKDVQSLLQPCASKPDGPAEPVMFVAAEQMAVALIDSKTMECTSWGGDGRIQLARAV